MTLISIYCPNLFLAPAHGVMVYYSTQARYVGTLNVNDNSDNDEIILSVGVKLLQILIVYRQTGHGYNGAVSRV